MPFKITLRQLNSFLAGFPAEIGDKFNGLRILERPEGEVLEVLLKGEGLVIGKRTVDEAIEALRLSTHTHAISNGAPTHYEGVPIVYRTADCSEAPQGDSDSISITLEIEVALSDLRIAMTRMVPLEPQYTPLHFLYREVMGWTFDFEGEGFGAFLAAQDELPFTVEADVTDYLETHGARLAELTADGIGSAIPTALLLEPGFSQAFRSDFFDGLNRAAPLLLSKETQARLEEIYDSDDYDQDDEIELGVEHVADRENLELVSKAMDSLTACVLPVFQRHEAEWLEILARATVNPRSLGFEPRPEVIGPVP